VLDLAPLLARVPDFREFMTLDELAASTQALVRDH